MSSPRIARVFEDARKRGRPAIIAYLCIGDPSVDASFEIARALLAAGADALELGAPFSDPTKRCQCRQDFVERTKSHFYRLNKTSRSSVISRIDISVLHGQSAASASSRSVINDLGARVVASPR